MGSDTSTSRAAAPVTTVGAYEQLLNSALRSDRMQDLPSILRLVTGDHTLPYNTRLRLLHAVCSVAAGSKEPLSTAGDVPARRAVAVFQPWFYFDFIRMVRSALDDGLLMPVFSGFRVTGKRVLAQLTPENTRSLRHRGVHLWDVCSYRLATSMRSLPEDIDPRNAAAMNRIREVFGEAAELIDEAHLFLNFYKPETVIYAQGHDLISAAMRHVAVQSGVRTVALENVFQKDKLGWEDISGVAVNTNLARNFYWRYRDFVPADAAEEAVVRFFETVDANKLAEHASRSVRTLPPYNGKTILYLGQVATDAAVLYGRRGAFRSQVDAMIAAAEAAHRTGAQLVIKLHPKESPHNPNPEPFFRELTSEWLAASLEFQRWRKMLGDRIEIDADNSLNTYSLIRAADVCVTINSQAGLEALALGRELVLCGDAFFGNLGFTHEARSPQEVIELITGVLAEARRLNTGAGSKIFFHTFTTLCCEPKEEATFLKLAAGRPSPRTPTPVQAK